MYIFLAEIHEADSEICQPAEPDQFELNPNESKPAVMLRGARHKNDLTQQELAKKIHANQAAIACFW